MSGDTSAKPAADGVGRWLIPFGAALAGLAVGAGGMTLIGGGGSEQKRIETVVRDYLLTNPEILPEAMDRLRAKQNASLVAESGEALTKPFAGAWMGAKDGDVVLVEFTDYNCGYCRASMPVVERLIAEDPKLKVVFRELPILSDSSVDAAQAALAAADQRKYAAFHTALFASGPVTNETIAAAQAKAGIDTAAAAAVAKSGAVRAELEANHALFRKLGATGTPSWVVGDELLQGAVGYDALKKAIADARKNTDARKK